MYPCCGSDAQRRGLSRSGKRSRPCPATKPLLLAACIPAPARARCSLYETAGGASGTTRFLYDGDELVTEYEGSGNLLRRYVHDSGSDDPMAWFEGASVADGVAKLIKTNHQGSVVALTDWNGNLANINSYDEWGIPAATNTGRFQYTGQAWIPELKMYHYKARIYSPTLGRFLQTDPIGYDDQVNLYAYVGNDPLNMVDPTGEQEAKFDRMAEAQHRQREEDFQAAEATYIADDPTNGDGHLSLNEANRHYRQGEGASVDVDATQLTYIPDKQATEAGETVSGKIAGGDYWVHGRNNATLQSDGTYRLVDGPYDFDIKGGLREIPRDFGARVGEDVATRGGRDPGQPFIIRYNGAPRVRVP